MWVWLQQEGDAEDAEEAAIRVFVESSRPFVSDLLVAAAPLFSFGGTREIQLRASQLQLLGSSGDPVSNRLELSTVAEEGATLRLRPRPNHCNTTPAGSEKRNRRQTFAKAPTHIPHTSQGPQRSLGAEIPDKLFNALPTPYAALRSRTQEFGPPPGASRPTAASQLRAKEGEARLSARQRETQEGKPRWSAATKVEATAVVPPPKPKVPSFSTQSKQKAAAPSEGVLTPEKADAPAKAPVTATEVVDGSGSGGVERDWEADFSLFYERHNPEKQQKVKELLTKHRGQESALWTMMLEKYQLTESNWKEAKAKQSSEEPAAAAATAEPPASETNVADTKDDDQ